MVIFAAPSWHCLLLQQTKSVIQKLSFPLFFSHERMIQENYLLKPALLTCSAIEITG
jgi:hypothetical protein